MTPSSCLMFAVIFDAMYSTASSESSRPSCAALFLIIAMRVSKSGGWISAIRPPSKRVCRRSSSRDISIGGRSDVRTIWCPAS